MEAAVPRLLEGPLPAASVHEPSSTLSKQIFTEALAKNDGEHVLFTAGGGGSGKSEAFSIAKDALNLGDTGLIFDSTLSSVNSAVKKIDEALATGAPVTILYTHRPVEKAFEFAMKRKRVVPLEVLARTHVNAADTIRALTEHYKDNPNVSISVVNNSGSLSEIKLGSLDDVSHYDYNQGVRRLNEQAKEAATNGTISEKTLKALGLQPETAGGNREVQGGEQGQGLAGPDQ